MAAPIGHNLGPEPTVEERKKEFADQIALWVGNQRLDDALAREELAQLEGVQRFLGLCKNLLLSVITICRRHKRADTRAGVMTLISFLSDNGSGTCVLSCVRMGQLLHRSDRRIREAINGLEADGLIGVDRTAEGYPRAYWPIVPRAIPEMNPASAWFVDALSDKPARRGRPKLVGKTPDANVRPFPDPSQKTPDADDKTPDVTQHCISLLDITRRSRSSSSDAPIDCVPEPDATVEFVGSGNPSQAPSAQKLTAPGSTGNLSDEEFISWNELYNSFGRRRDEIVPRPASRDETDPVLADLVRTNLSDHSPSVRARALAATMSDARAITADDREAGVAGRGQNRLRRLSALFNAHLSRNADRIERADKSAVASDRAELAVQEKLLSKRLRGVESGGAGRQPSNRRKSWSDIADEV